MTKDQANAIKVLILEEASCLARRDYGVDKILDILILAGIIEKKQLEDGSSCVHINSIHNHDNAYEDVGENYIGDKIEG